MHSALMYLYAKHVKSLWSWDRNSVYLLAMGMLDMAILQGNRHGRLEIPQGEEGLEHKFLTICLNRAGQVVD